MENPQDHFKRPNKISILFSIAVIIALFFTIYAQIKSTEVKELEAQLEEVQLENRKLKDEAETLIGKALEMAAISKQAEIEALKQKELADRALLEFQKCQSK